MAGLRTGVKYGRIRIMPGAKYGSRRTLYGGIEYHSKKEADYAAELDLRIRAGDIKRWGRQVPIPLEVEGVRVALYLMDFEIWHLNGSIEWVEVKGYQTDLWKLKWKMLQAMLPRYRKQLKTNITLTLEK